jgi:hypothetical protein
MSTPYNEELFNFFTKELRGVNELEKGWSGKDLSWPDDIETIAGYLEVRMMESDWLNDYVRDYYDD